MRLQMQAIAEIILVLFLIALIFFIVPNMVQTGTSEDDFNKYGCQQSILANQRAVASNTLKTIDVNCPISTFELNEDLIKDEPVNKDILKDLEENFKTYSDNPELVYKANSYILKKMNNCYDKVNRGKYDLFANDVFVIDGTDTMFCLVCDVFTTEETLANKITISGQREIALQLFADKTGDTLLEDAERSETPTSANYIDMYYKVGSQQAIVYTVVNYKNPIEEKDLTRIMTKLLFSPDVKREGLPLAEYVLTSIGRQIYYSDVQIPSDVQFMGIIDFSDPKQLKQSCSQIVNERNIAQIN